MLFLATGGTFDKDYDSISGALSFPRSRLKTLLDQANLGFDYTHEVIMQKDSLEMTDDDREKILSRCNIYTHQQVVIVHGTDTMVETAQYLALHAKANQTVVLTGAMRPAAFGQSDALFNLGFAVACAQLQPQGVYVAMNGICFSAHSVVKNRTLGIFEPVLV